MGGAPDALNTLRELADALGDDSNFASTVINQLAGKQNKLTPDAPITLTTDSSGNSRVGFSSTTLNTLNNKPNALTANNPTNGVSVLNGTTVRGIVPASTLSASTDSSGNKK